MARRWATAYMEADGKSMANLYSTSDAVRYIGSDPEEVWRGAEIATALPFHMLDIRDRLGVVIDIADIEAFELGKSGWASIRAMVRFGDRAPVELRVTLVFALEDGVWRIVYSANGLVRDNLDVVGIAITKGLEALLGEMGDNAEEQIRASIREGMATLMFTDIEGSTEWLTRVGDEAWARVVGWHDQTVRRIVDEHSGTVVKTLGDGAMAAFDSVRSAARAAIAIQGAMGENADAPDLRVRIGLHVGEVLQMAEDYLGQAVNKAARIASAAEGGEIKVSTAVAALLADGAEFMFGTPVDTELKGLPGVHPVMTLQPRS